MLYFTISSLKSFNFIFCQREFFVFCRNSYPIDKIVQGTKQNYGQSLTFPGMPLFSKSRVNRAEGWGVQCRSGREMAMPRILNAGIPQRYWRFASRPLQKSES